ncbi:MAG: tol-pal system protein YbgF [Alphaproteobacteria bacterium]|nr:tol-pal system protein YbgF [Alphaproteobacteria bacterium]
MPKMTPSALPSRIFPLRAGIFPLRVLGIPLLAACLFVPPAFAAPRAPGAATNAAQATAGRQYAQLWSDYSDREVTDESRRLSRSLGDDNAQPGHQRVAGLFGKSDDEIAAEQAAQQREDAQDASIRDLRQRVSDLEDSVRRLTGQMEVLGHRMQQMKTDTARAQKDFEYRICTMAAHQLGASGDQNGEGLDCGAMQQSGPQSGPQPGPLPGGQQQGSIAPSGNTGMNAGAPPPGGSQHYATQSPQRLQPYESGSNAYDSGNGQLAPPPGVLGTLNQNDLNDVPRGPSSHDYPPPDDRAGPASSAPRQLGDAGGNTRAQYNAAMQMLSRARYDDARSAFRGFVDANPNDALAPQALYWVGDIAYVQKDYQNAARAFAENIKKYPTSTRAPDSMLKLGQALIAMGQKQEGCTTLGALKAKYPSASKTIVDQAHSDRKAASCRAA